MSRSRLTSPILIVFTLSVVLCSAQDRTLTVQGNLSVVGSSTINGAVQAGGLTVSGDSSIKGGQVITGGQTIGGTLGVTGATTVNDLSVNGTTQVKGQFILQVVDQKFSGSCTPGRLVAGAGGSDSNGKGGWLYYCRLGGTWASVNFQNESSAGSAQEGVIADLQQEVKELRQLVCQQSPRAAVCAEVALKNAQPKDKK